MCLAVPARVTKILERERARVEVGGVQTEVSLSLVEGIEVGDEITERGVVLENLRVVQREEIGKELFVRFLWQCHILPGG